jgi:hypothetical protein
MLSGWQKRSLFKIRWAKIIKSVSHLDVEYRPALLSAVGLVNSDGYQLLHAFVIATHTSSARKSYGLLTKLITS